MVSAILAPGECPYDDSLRVIGERRNHPLFCHPSVLELECELRSLSDVVGEGTDELTVLDEELVALTVIDALAQQFPSRRPSRRFRPFRERPMTAEERSAWLGAPAHG